MLHKICYGLNILLVIILLAYIYIELYNHNKEQNREKKSTNIFSRLYEYLLIISPYLIFLLICIIPICINFVENNIMLGAGPGVFNKFKLPNNTEYINQYEQIFGSYSFIYILISLICQILLYSYFIFEVSTI